MKNLAVILLATIPFFGFAQQNDPNEQSSGIVINCKVCPEKKSVLILINNIPFKESSPMSMIDSKDISNLRVIKDKDSLAQYGDRAKDGIIKITVPDIDKYAQYLEILEEKEEYETIVFAPGFESFLTMQPSKSYFTESWLKSKNTQMVTEWNYRHGNPNRYSSHIYEEAVNYDSKTDYGLDVEYTLYMFFRFMEKENNMSLIFDRQITQH